MKQQGLSLKEHCNLDNENFNLNEITSCWTTVYFFEKGNFGVWCVCAIDITDGYNRSLLVLPFWLLKQYQSWKDTGKWSIHNLQYFFRSLKGLGNI